MNRDIQYCRECGAYFPAWSDKCLACGADSLTVLDISDTTATAADVARGKYFYTAQGVRVAGTGSGGGCAAQITGMIDLTPMLERTVKLKLGDYQLAGAYLGEVKVKICFSSGKKRIANMTIDVIGDLE